MFGENRLYLAVSVACLKKRNKTKPRDAKHVFDPLVLKIL
jgi:hypothetical protein